MDTIFYTNKIINFEQTNLNKNTGKTYSAKKIALKINNLEIELELIVNLKIIENATKWKSNTRIESWDTSDKRKDKLSNSDIERNIWPIFSKLINICDNQFNSFLIANDNILPNNFVVNIDTESLLIPKNKIFDEKELHTLLNNNTNKLKIFDTSFLISIDTFLLKWNKMILKDAPEVQFRNFLLENKRLFPTIFGLDDINKIYDETFHKEEKLSELSNNSTDISNESFCIELKKPSTKIFGSKNKRKNIEGLSSELVSATNQLNLYLLKKDRKKELELFSFTKGILIIGSKSQFIDKENNLLQEKVLSWNLFRQNYKFDILTFDDITQRVEKLKESIINLSQNVKYEEECISEPIDIDYYDI